MTLAKGCGPVTTSYIWVGTWTVTSTVAPSLILHVKAAVFRTLSGLPSHVVEGRCGFVVSGALDGKFSWREKLLYRSKREPPSPVTCHDFGCDDATMNVRSLNSGLILQLHATSRAMRAHA